MQGNYFEQFTLKNLFKALNFEVANGFIEAINFINFKDFMVV
jgi:hypothetical protein